VEITVEDRLAAKRLDGLLDYVEALVKQDERPAARLGSTGSPTVRNSSFTNTSLPISPDYRSTQATATDRFGCALNGFKEPRRRNLRNAAALGSRCQMIQQNRRRSKTYFIAG
jgi:hypothetical protein